MITFENTEDFISVEEAKYWKRMFLSNLKMGVEIEADSPPSGRTFSASGRRDIISRKLKPTNEFGVFGENGVYKVVSDGSLNGGGVEVCTVGRRINFVDLYSQYKHICNMIINQGFKITQRCGLHTHVLFTYYDERRNELEKPVPDIIMKNYFQLVRRYIPALVWITSTIFSSGDTGIVTRYEQFCRTEAIFRFTPIGRTFHEYIYSLRRNSTGGRYEFCNMIPIKTSNEGTNRMHFEFRFADGSFYPAQIVAQNILFASIFIKAIELSQTGLISTGTSEYWEETKNIYKKLRQREGFSGTRYSRPIGDETKDTLIARAVNMLDELKHGIYFYEPLAYRILKILASTPISIMRHSYTDDEINDSFNNLINNYYDNDITDCNDLIEAINLQQESGSVSVNQWLYKFSESNNKNYKEVEKKYKKLNKLKPMEFDTSLGVPYFK